MRDGIRVQGDVRLGQSPSGQDRLVFNDHTGLAQDGSTEIRCGPKLREARDLPEDVLRQDAAIQSDRGPVGGCQVPGGAEDKDRGTGAGQGNAGRHRDIGGPFIDALVESETADLAHGFVHIRRLDRSVGISGLHVVFSRA